MAGCGAGAKATQGFAWSHTCLHRRHVYFIKSISISPWVPGKGPYANRYRDMAWWGRRVSKAGVRAGARAERALRVGCEQHAAAQQSVRRQRGALGWVRAEQLLVRGLVKQQAAVASPALPCSWDTAGAQRRCRGRRCRRRRRWCSPWRQSRRYGWRGMGKEHCVQSQLSLQGAAAFSSQSAC